MRINIYNEELTADWIFVKREVEETGNTYYGLRVFLKSQRWNGWIPCMGK